MYNTPHTYTHTQKPNNINWWLRDPTTREAFPATRKMENINKIPYDVEGKEKKKNPKITKKKKEKKKKKWKIMENGSEVQRFSRLCLGNPQIYTLYKFQRKSFLVNVIAEVASDHFLSFAPTQHFPNPPTTHSHTHRDSGLIVSI